MTSQSKCAELELEPSESKDQHLTMHAVLEEDPTNATYENYLFKLEAMETHKFILQSKSGGSDNPEGSGRGSGVSALTSDREEGGHSPAPTPSLSSDVKSSLIHNSLHPRETEW